MSRHALPPTIARRVCDLRADHGADAAWIVCDGDGCPTAVKVRRIAVADGLVKIGWTEAPDGDYCQVCTGERTSTALEGAIPAT
ncbi:MAG TPA: hypothetical protein VFQ12_03030 [Thermoleophilaceae bacterium]|nr:hypothetical protein [Thermoleophilaceae bacterium]